MKTTLLSLLFLIFLLFIACNDDPINNDEDKLVETLEDYRIVYTTIEYGKPSVYISDFTGEDNHILFDSVFAVTTPANKIGFFNKWVGNKNINAFTYNFETEESNYSIIDPESRGMFIYPFPNNKKVLMYPSMNDGEPMYLGDPDGKNKITITENSSSWFTDISPDSKNILFASEGKWYLCEDDGSNMQYLFEQNMQFSVYWHNDSKRLILSKSMDVNITNIELYNTETMQSEALITLDDGEYSQAKISPDGKKIAFYDNKLNVYTVNSDGKNLTTLRAGGTFPVHDFEFSRLEWAPDSKHILVDKFNNDSDNNHGTASGLEVINIETKETNVIHNEDNAFTAFWVKVK